MEEILNQKLTELFQKTIYQIVSIADGEIISKYPEYEKSSMKVYSDLDELSNLFIYLFKLLENKDNVNKKTFTLLYLNYQKNNKIFEVDTTVILSENKEDFYLIVDVKESAMTSIPDFLFDINIKSR